MVQHGSTFSKGLIILRDPYSTMITCVEILPEYSTEKSPSSSTGGSLPLPVVKENMCQGMRGKKGRVEVVETTVRSYIFEILSVACVTKVRTEY